MSDPRPVNPAGAHDMGGLEGPLFDAPIDREEHDPAYWERRIDAMLRLLMGKGVLADVSELRRGIESLEPGDYDRLGYYERWAHSIAVVLTERGLVAEAEIDAKIEEIRARMDPGA